MRTTIAFILGFSALSLPSSALAQEADDDIVVTATGIAQPREETGQAITVIDAAEIERRQSLTVTDLVATVPGVRFSRSGPEGGVTGISLRGAETTQTLVLIDGVKVNDPSGIGDMFDFGSLLTGNLKRVEILRGANSLAHGSQAIGGVVAVSTDAPTAGVSASASGEYGYRDTANGTASINLGNDMVAGRIGVAGFRTDGISGASEALGATEKDGYRNLAVNGRLVVNPKGDINLDLRAYYIDADLHYDSFFGAPADSPDIARTGQYVGYAGINASLFDGLLTNRIAATYYRTTRDYYFAPADTPDYGYKGRNLRFEYQGVLQPLEQAKLIFGYEHEAPRYTAFGFGTAKEKADIDSLFGLAVVNPLPGLSLTGGVRYDDHSQFGSATTFGANAGWTIGSGTHLRAAYGEGFKAPSLYQLYDSFSGNAALRPERAKSYDIGIDQDVIDGAAQFSLTWFRRDTRNQINFDNATFVYGNLDRTRATGVEANLTLRPAEGFVAVLGYSRVDAKDKSAVSPNFGRRLARRAKDAASLSVDYAWSFGLSTGATVTMVGDSFENAANSIRLDGYALAGVRAAFLVTERIEIFGRVDNLFDELYATADGYGTYGRSAFVGARLKL